MPGSARGVVLVAAVGPRTNLDLVRRNLQKFEPSRWDCVLLAWHAVDVIERRCKVIVRTGRKWASLLNTSRPLVARGDYAHVTIMLDDVELDTPHLERTVCWSARSSGCSLGAGFDADELAALVSSHRLGVISPLVVNATNSVMRPMMASHGRINVERLKKRQRYGSLELVNAIETYLSVYSRAAWECHASLFDDVILREGRQAVGRGYDRCYHPHCHHATGGQALVTTMVVAHVGGWGGLSHRHGLAKQARGQQRRLSAWVAAHDNTSCVGAYRKLANFPDARRVNCTVKTCGAHTSAYAPSAVRGRYAGGWALES